MRRVFVDSGAFFALLVPQDKSHEAATEAFRQAEADRWELSTTNVALVRSHADKTYSLCDALSFVVMERLGIDEAIAYDRHFREYGRFRMV